MKSLLAAEANRHFSSLLREMAQGEAVTVLSHGKPVTTISSVTRQDNDGLDAQTALLTRLRQQTPSGSRDWRRDDLYDSPSDNFCVFPQKNILCQNLPTVEIVEQSGILYSF